MHPVSCTWFLTVFGYIACRVGLAALRTEGIAREPPTLFFDVDGAARYWDSYESVAAVVPRDAESADDAVTYALDETPFTYLSA